MNQDPSNSTFPTAMPHGGSRARGPLFSEGELKPDCAKCGRPYHTGQYWGGTRSSDCDGYEPTMSDADLPPHPANADAQVFQEAYDIASAKIAQAVLAKDAHGVEWWTDIALAVHEGRNSLFANG